MVSLRESADMFMDVLAGEGAGIEVKEVEDQVFALQSQFGNFRQEVSRDAFSEQLSDHTVCQSSVGSFRSSSTNSSIRRQRLAEMERMKTSSQYETQASQMQKDAEAEANQSKLEANHQIQIAKQRAEQKAAEAQRQAEEVAEEAKRQAEAQAEEAKRHAEEVAKKAKRQAEQVARRAEEEAEKAEFNARQQQMNVDLKVK